MLFKINISKSVFTITAIIIAALRLLGDTLFFFLKQLDTNTAIVWKTVSFLAIVSIVIASMFHKSFTTGKYTDNNIREEFLPDSLKLLGFALIMIVIENFLPETVSAYLLENSLFYLLITDITALFMTVFVCFCLYLFFKWTNLTKHKKSKIINRTLSLSYAILIISEIIHYFYNSSFLKIINGVILILTVFLIIFQFSNTSWIALLPRGKKFKTVTLSLLGFFCLLTLHIASTDTDQPLNSAMMYFSYFGSVLMFPSFCLVIAFAKISFSTIISLPTTGIVERRTFEIESLTYLNKIVANTVEFDNLLKTICQLALNTTNGQIAWVEIFSQDNSSDKLYSENIEPEYIKQLHNDQFANQLLNTTNQSLLITSIDNEIESNPQFSVFGFASSMVIIPLFFKADKIGNLVVMSNDEYGLDNDTLNILHAFKDNISIAMENLKLLEDSIEKEKYKQEIALAKEMQDKLLPKIVPQHSGYSIAAFTNSAEVVGGDYYDIVYLKNGKMCLLIGDVSGKGISAAFYMAQLKGVVLSQAKEAVSSADILNRINAVLYGKMDRQMYITLSALVIDDEDGNISFARGGHMPTIIKSNSEITFHQPKGFGIGLVPPKMFGQNLEEVSLKLKKGDICFLFTDGVNELRDKSGEEFGYEHLKLLLSSNVFISADSIIENTKRCLLEFSRDTKQLDDITIVTIIFNGQQN